MLESFMPGRSARPTRPDRLRTQDQSAPYKIETGTLNHAAIVGVKAAIEYIAALASGPDLRSKIVSAMKLIGQHETPPRQRVLQRTVNATRHYHLWPAVWLCLESSLRFHLRSSRRPAEEVALASRKGLLHMGRSFSTLSVQLRPWFARARRGNACRDLTVQHDGRGFEAPS